MKPDAKAGTDAAAGFYKEVSIMTHKASGFPKFRSTIIAAQTSRYTPHLCQVRNYRLTRFVVRNWSSCVSTVRGKSTSNRGYFVFFGALSGV